MKTIKILFVLFFIPISIFSQLQKHYSNNYKFYPSAPGALRFGLNGFDNPALLTYVKNFDGYFIWSTGNKNFSNLNNYGVFLATNNLGFGYTSLTQFPGRINSYYLAMALGDKNNSLGFSYKWNSTDIPSINLKNSFTLATLIRPIKYLSLGLISSSDENLKDFEIASDIAIRPFGNEKITLFADYYYFKSMTTNDNYGSIGVVVEPFEGIQLIGRYFKLKEFNLGLQLSLGNLSVLQMSKFDNQRRSIDQVYGIRFGSYDRNIISKLIQKEKTHRIDLNGELKYQRYQFFDKSKTLYELINKLEMIKEDKSIKQVEINTSGLLTGKVFLWELRKKLEELKDNGKTIIIYLDNANLDLYHFASVGNRIIMDPMGLISLEGVLMGRNFYKGTLDKLGIGFDEWRFFKYKSAAETFSREKMSEADREQRQLIVDNLYNSFREDIQSSRKQLKLPVDSLVNNYVVFNAQEALELGLVDSLARWYEIKDTDGLANVARFIRDNTIEKEKLNEDNYWSEKPKIAIMYVLGVCAMDEGIKARTLIKDVEKVSKDNSIKAVVFRVDSPGGDALASDVIAEGMKKVKKNKPVIVSQGFVAGSGGYWLSMYGDTIVSNPNTITGSIGVIGSWFYNKGFKESFGVSTDHVKQGAHADLGFGMIIPIINAIIPDRKPTNDEREKIELMIRNMYSEFINRVAAGRNKSIEEIENVSQGRVWSGKDAINLGLVDVLGGLEDAIEIARQKANLKKGEFEIVEYPKAPLMDLSEILPVPLGISQKQNDIFYPIQFRFKYNGKPLLMMPMDLLPETEFYWNDF